MPGVAAKVHTADLDTEVRSALLKDLEQIVTWQRMAAPAGWPLVADGRDEENGEDQAVEIDLAPQSNGRPVFAMVDWGDSYATVVHHIDSLQPDTEDTDELVAEVCLCGGMPSTEREPMTMGMSALQAEIR